MWPWARPWATVPGRCACTSSRSSAGSGPARACWHWAAWLPPATAASAASARRRSPHERSAQAARAAHHRGGDRRPVLPRPCRPDAARGDALRRSGPRRAALGADQPPGAGVRAAGAARPVGAHGRQRPARRALRAQRLGQLVRGLPRRAPGADPLRRDPARARGRLQLEGRAGGRAALAGALRQSVFRGTGRLRRPLRPGLGRGRRAGDLPGRRQRRRALEAHRTADRRGARRQPAAGARTGGARAMTGLAAARARTGIAGHALRLLLAALLATACVPAALAQAAGDAAPLSFNDTAEARRFHALTAELRCVMCQNQSLADSNAQIAHDMRREVLSLMRQGLDDEQIKRHLVDRYGEFVLYRPRVDSHTWLLWFGPGLILLAGAGMVWGVVRRRARAEVPGNDEPPTEHEW